MFYLCYIIIRYSTSTFNFFSDQNIPGPKPIPLVGNAWGMWKRVYKNSLKFKMRFYFIFNLKEYARMGFGIDEKVR